MRGSSRLAGDATSLLTPLMPDQHAWAEHSAALWREAHVIAAAHPGLDPGDVYHALRSLELAPAERLRRGLTRVRNRPDVG
jgi:hypothetical protein